MKPWLLTGMLMLLPLSAAQADAKKTVASVPAGQQQAFQLGYALQAPAAQAEQFLQAVKTLKAINDEAALTAEIGRFAKGSVTLRAAERRAYRQAAQQMQALNAPADLLAWPEHAAARLDAPLTVSPQDKAGSDPDTATILGTIDEAREEKANADRHLPALLAWVKLTQGGDAVWATALGGLAARMHAAVAAGQSLSLARADTKRLRDTAPFGTPGPVLDALTGLTPHVGNLASLVPLPATPVSPKDLKGPQTTLLDAYAARPLAQAIDKSP